METILSILVGSLFGAGLYLLLHRSFIKLILGIIIFANAANLFLLVAGRITRDTPAFVREHEEVQWAHLADPLPQALILTAIVIGFGIQTFAIVLLKRVYHTANTSDLDELNNTDQIEHV